jgi:alkanesulfonate monooxygenase SsuD/methylene tetrahydromethanopterin reductase-like flavin-dependent oxidoreductase (luciferase family)
VRVALMIEGQEGVSWPEWVALAEACEEHGIEAMFRSDHYLSQTDPTRLASDAWTLLGALAAHTSRLRLGTLVSPVTFRHPAVLAKAAATADHVSGGRIEVGIGAGWMVEEHERFGLPFPPLDERLRAFAAQVEAVDRLLREEPLCVQSPRPPLIVGGGARGGTTIPAARFADEYNTYGVDPAEAARRRKRLDETCEEVGREPASIAFSVMTRYTEDLHARVDAYEAAGVERLMVQHLDHEDLDVVAAIATF